ncbi:MAG: hypothetical protein ACK5LC_18015, partial [Coprobacillaceae bacterium]
WVLNYLLFEIYKMSYDMCKTKLSIKVLSIIFIVIPLLMMLGIYFILPMIFGINIILLGIFMIIRTIRRLLKQK